MNERIAELEAINEGLRRELEERRRADAELRRGEERYRSLVEATTAVVWNTPASGEFEAEQPGWSAFTGQTFEQLRGWGWLDAVHPDDRPTTARVWSAAVASRSLYHVEHRLRRHDGEYRQMLVRAVPILDESGAIREWVGVHTDVTEQKRVEAVLREAKAAAEAANRTKSEFLAKMSHEIRTPMNGVLGMAELLLNTSLTPLQREYLNTLRNSADALLRLLNDILDFSKVEAGKLELEQIAFSLRDSLGDAMHVLAMRAAQKGLELACHIGPEVPDALTGDPGRLRQILVNLAGNAIKFTETGEVVVAVAVETQTPEEVELHFTVSDTGIGIPADKLRGIFEPFGQADTSTTRRYGGTGLGLTISAQLVALMRGRTWVESEVGKGSVFHFLAHFGLAKEARGAKPLPEFLAGLPVLVVDDNQTNRRVLEAVLTSWGMLPALTDGGRSALAEVAQATRGGRPFPLALLDVMMPEMDGLGLARAIRQEPGMDGCVLLLLSSAGQPVDAETCQALRIARCLTKPVKQSDLLGAILDALTPRGSAEGAPPSRPREPAGSVTPRRVLLAEDGLVNQQVAVGLLRLRGHEVVVANNGKEALAALEKESFDVVLMDVQMPEMDGWQATAAIRRKEQEKGGRVRIIAMTAHAMKGDREACLGAGMDGYISKPFQTEALYEAVEAHGPGSGEPSPGEEAARPDAGVFDWSAALRRVGGQADLLSTLADSFCEEAAELMPQIRQAVAGRDGRGLLRSAHTLKGAAACFHAEATVAAAARLEEMGRKGELAGAVEALEVLERAVERLLRALAACKAGR